MGEHSASSRADTQPAAEATPFVVGLGASAGGIAALKKFFAHVPADSGAAYVVILHLSPNHDSQLAQVLQSTAAIPVTQITERAPIVANHVYVMSPNRYLRIEEGTIVVSEITRPEHRRAPVDLFFRSLAEAQGSRAVCVVLSGTGANGSSGLKRVKEWTGLAIAQDPEEAEHGDMPRNSIATGLIDFVLPVAEIPAKIQDFHARLRIDAETADQPVTDPEALRDILSILRIRTGNDFSNYKPGTIQRRVTRRVHLLSLGSIQEYARIIRDSRGESAALMKDLLISVTSFFRDVSVFEALASRILPQIMARKRRHEPVRCWVPGCATGEEAYSIAMLLAEHASSAAGPPPVQVQVFATDLDESAIAIAREAFYTYADVADMPEARLQQFFIGQPGGYRVRRDLRETVLFAHHNVIRDPPFSHIDLISCRNLLIYLNREAQERVLETFHFALKPGGYLLLGPSETPDHPNDLFAVVDKRARIFESRVAAGRTMLPAIEVSANGHRVPFRDGAHTDRIAPADLHHRLLEQYAPPSVVITEEHQVVHMSERAGEFMQLPGGEPSRDLLRIVRTELRAALRAALHQAVRERHVVEVEDLAVVMEDGERQVNLTVRPVLRDQDPAQGFLLVTFDARAPLAPDDAPRPVARRNDLPTVELEDEIARVKQQLRITIEQYETQVEEAKATNEELLAMNEELRSSAEELETSREELQSVNEELTTVNQELKIKVEELWLSNNDFQNLINSGDIGTIFLDRDLRLKLATPAASQVFNLLGSDIGRPLSDITSSLQYEHLYDDARRVLEDLRSIELEVQTLDGRWILSRVSPYRTTDNRIDGVVITLQDITERRRAQERLLQGEERLRLLVDGAIDYAIFTMTSDGAIDSWNSGAKRMFGYDANEIVGQHFAVLFTAEDRAAGVPALQLRDAYEQGRAADERFHLRRDGARFHCSGTTIRLGESLGFAKIARDLSNQQEAADALRLIEADFESRLRERTDLFDAEVRARTAAHNQVSSLLGRIVTAQEDERARIARDLHDQLGQQLTALRLTLERHRQLLASGEARDDEIVTALSIADRIDSDIDFLAWQLRPTVLDDVGLAAALPLFVREWSEHHGVTAEYRAGSFAAGQLGRDAEVVFYRVAQEALNNVAKHAHASRVDVLLEKRDRSVVLVVEDNGVGFEPADKDVRDRGIGIMGMHERASLIGGSLDVESRIGQGTSVFLRAAVGGMGRSDS